MQSLLSQPLADRFRLRIRERAARLIDRGIEPQLAVVLVGSNEESLTYVAIKQRTARELGIILSLYHLEEDAPYDELAETVAFLNADPDIHGIIIQLPLPGAFSEGQVDALLASVAPAKDVDGLGGSWRSIGWRAATFEELARPQPAFLPPMVASVLSLLDWYGVRPDAGSIAIIGKGRLVGGPLEAYFKSCGYNATAMDEETAGIIDAAKAADLLIAGTGERDLVTYQWVKPGATVVDCAADVHRDSVEQVAGAVAPSVGGVGPLTVLWLLHNLTLAAENAGGAE